MTLRLYNYNNYYNRQIKSAQWALDNVDELYIEYDINFNPNDGITTEHIMGGANTYTGTADYAILVDGQEIVSSWFIIENQRTRAGQYKIILKRDTVGENLDKVLSAPCFVEKGWVSNTDPAIFNTENMTYNQIKKAEVLLKDKTQMPWLVGYYNKNKTLNVNIPETEFDADYVVNGIENWEYYQYTTDFGRVPTGFDVMLNFNTVSSKGASVVVNNLTTTSNNLEVMSAGVSDDYTGYHYTVLLNFLGYAVDKNVMAELSNKIKANSNRLFLSARSAFTSGFISQTEYDALFSLADRTIFDSTTGKLYQIGYDRKIGDASYTASTNPDLTSSFGFEMYSIYNGIDGISGSRPSSNSSNNNFTINVSRSNSIKLTLKEISYKSYKLTLSPSSEAQTSHSPYNIFAIPYGPMIFGTGEQYITTDPDTSIRICMELIKEYSGASGELIDVQLLPYCPIAEIRNRMEATTKPIFLLDNIPNSMWAPINDPEDNMVGVAFYCIESSHQFTINYQIKIDNIKVSNETEMCRLISPNWNGMFEFSPAKNYGVEYFTVDYELKPFQPYIHVAPAWNGSGLYGKRDNDAIGLICGGDFGLTMVSDAWATYERQNKNYREIFDRQIQNLEVQHKYQRVQETVGALVGTAGGAAGGAMLGSMLGGPNGAVVGGVAGGVLSAAGGVADLGINEGLRTEAMDYTKDLFGYQMGNIRALPQSLTRVNSLNPNNTIFPILEFYGCTEQETAALLNKLIYNGYTVGRIGQLKDYINPTADSTYIKGQLILLEDLGEDSHLADDIANEIYKGVRV